MTIRLYAIAFEQAHEQLSELADGLENTTYRGVFSPELHHGLALVFSSRSRNGVISDFRQRVPHASSIQIIDVTDRPAIVQEARQGERLTGTSQSSANYRQDLIRHGLRLFPGYGFRGDLSGRHPLYSLEQLRSLQLAA